jgi:LEA14-like dessication related protein
MKHKVKLLKLLPLFLCLFPLFTTTACTNPAEKITVVRADMPALKGLTSLQGSLTVKNDNGQAVAIENATITVYYRDKKLMETHLADAIKLPPRKTTDVTYTLVIDNLSFAALTMLPSAISSPELVTADIAAQVKYGATRKKIVMNNVPLMDIITTFGA